VTDRTERFERAKGYLGEAEKAIEDLHLADVSKSNDEDLRELLEDLRYWRGQFESWEQEAREEGETEGSA
jgi:hypothetical protein